MAAKRPKPKLWSGTDFEVVMMFTYLLILLFWVFLIHGTAQHVDPPARFLSQEQIGILVQEVADTGVLYLAAPGAASTYTFHGSDGKDDETSEVIGSVDGRVWRVLKQNGALISAERNSKETQRLENLLKPGKLQSQSKSAARMQPYFRDLIRAMPQAMLYAATPGQPQLPNLDRRQIVLDYSPNPAFYARSLAEHTLNKLSGRLWMDAVDHHLVRMEIHINDDVNVVGGLVAKVYSGGTVEYDQRRIEEGRYAWTHIKMHLRVRELLLKTIPAEVDLTATDIRLLPTSPTGPDAIHSLLAMQVKTP